jgi:hypothetical protein
VATRSFVGGAGNDVGEWDEEKKRMVREKKK